MRFLLELSYNGTNYQGWQVQPNGNTIQGVLNNALSVLLRQGIETQGCGRTDSGVHARQYFAQFDSDYDLPETFLKSLNGILPYDIAVHSVRLVPPDFNVRFNAIARTYEYCITFEKNPFCQNFATRWHVPLDINAMNNACEAILGERDFSCFSRVNTDVQHYICNLMSARWYYRNDLLIFEVTANRFLRSMVRAMVGTLTLVGEGKIDTAKFLEIVESKDRRMAGTSVPPMGFVPGGGGVLIVPFGSVQGTTVNDAISWVNSKKNLIFAPMKFGVVIFPGSNCDRDLIETISAVSKSPVEELWHKDTDLKGVDFVFLPGGFSYGDYLRSGAIAKLSPVMQSIGKHAAAGGYVMGICNGFQILCESGLLPGALLRNTNRQFICKNVFLKPENAGLKITNKLSVDKAYKIPVAHGEGRYYADEATLRQMEDKGQIVFRYVSEAGIVDDESNPNGSLNNIAGICNSGKNVFGMMPHPERCATGHLLNTDGLGLFESILAS